MTFRFVASIRRENFPEYLISSCFQPGHTIVLISPLTITNLLSCDLHYSIKEANVRGHIKPGLSAAIHEVSYFTINFSHFELSLIFVLILRLTAIENSKSTFILRTFLNMEL